MSCHGPSPVRQCKAGFDHSKLQPHQFGIPKYGWVLCLDETLAAPTRTSSLPSCNTIFARPLIGMGRKDLDTVRCPWAVGRQRIIKRVSTQRYLNAMLEVAALESSESSRLAMAFAA